MGRGRPDGLVLAEGVGLTVAVVVAVGVAVAVRVGLAAGNWNFPTRVYQLLLLERLGKDFRIS